MESIVLGIYLWFKIYFLIDTNAKMLTEFTDHVVLGRNYWSSCRLLLLCLYKYYCISYASSLQLCTAVTGSRFEITSGRHHIAQISQHYIGSRWPLHLHKYIYCKTCCGYRLDKKTCLSCWGRNHYGWSRSQSEYWSALLIYKFYLWSMYGDNFLLTSSQRVFLLTTGNNLSYFTPNSKLLLHFW